MKRFKFPTISFPKITLPSIRIRFSFPFRKVVMILVTINTVILVTLGSIGLFVSYINPIPHITPYIPIHIATQLFDTVVYLQANLPFTIGISVGLIVIGLLLHAANFRTWWKTFKAAPMAVVKAPVRFYKKITGWRNWLLAKVTYLNEESAKWKTIFKIMMSPYSFLRMMGFSPQMAIGLLAVGGTAGSGVVINETVLADRSFSNGDSGIYAAPSQNPSPTLEQEMEWRKQNKGDNTLRIVLGATPVREIKIENVSVGTVYANSTVPSSAYTPASGDAATSTPVLIGGTVISGGTSTFLEIGELILEKSRCTYLSFDNTTAHTINVIGNASDGQSINQTPGTSRMRAIGGGHHQAEAMVTSGGSYDRIHIDAPTTAVNGKIGKLTLSNLYTEGGACVFDRMKIGTLTIQLNEIGAGDGFATKEFKINQSVTSANWTVTDNIELSIAAPTETLSNE
tara:strand:- start:6843 stop:8207 length:1365 start_codon:yes stop_codon:yes gene_type:complete